MSHKKEHPRWQWPKGVSLDDLGGEHFWTDTSWHNDAMPSWETVNKYSHLRLWIDYPKTSDDPEEHTSEMWEEVPRFGLARVDEHGEFIADWCGSNEWSEIVQEFNNWLDWSNAEPIGEHEFHSVADVEAYLRLLVSKNMHYHLDDDPTEIEWCNTELTDSEIDTLSINHSKLWAFCNPWEVFEEHPELWELYRNY